MVVDREQHVGAVAAAMAADSAKPMTGNASLWPFYTSDMPGCAHTFQSQRYEMCLKPGFQQQLRLTRVCVGNSRRDLRGTHAQAPPQRHVQAPRANYSRAAKMPRGEGGGEMHDAPVIQQDVNQLVYGWDESLPMPPDLLPRAAFKSDDANGTMVWLLQCLVGPASLACRPSLWRGALMWALWKRGDPRSLESFRLIMVKSQMGLLQEGLLTQRLTLPLRSALTPGQSGYARGVEDPHLLLHELVTESLAAHRCLWHLPADSVKAFPNTLREDLLVRLARNAKASAGAFLRCGAAGCRLRASFKTSPRGGAWRHRHTRCCQTR